jgi:hypothetical protein
VDLVLALGAERGRGAGGRVNEEQRFTIDVNGTIASWGVELSSLEVNIVRGCELSPMRSVTVTSIPSDVERAERALLQRLKDKYEARTA